jgi:hypothetical protein
LVNALVLTACAGGTHAGGKSIYGEKFADEVGARPLPSHTLTQRDRQTVTHAVCGCAKPTDGRGADHGRILS